MYIGSQQKSVHHFVGIFPTIGEDMSRLEDVGNLASSDGASPSICVEKVISECTLAAALRDHAGNSFSCVLNVRRVEAIVIDFSRQNDVAELSSAHPNSKSQALENGLNGFSSAENGGAIIPH